MPAIDFTTAFGRLLQDGALRDELAIDPAQVATKLELRGSDHAALLSLNVEDLEYQAQVLLRKRLDAVRHVLPMTCRRLADQSWPLFLKYARSFWPKGNLVAAADAYAFCSSLDSAGLKLVDPREWNRLRFVFSGRTAAVYLVTSKASAASPAVQLLFRLRPNRWREILLCLKF